MAKDTRTRKQKRALHNLIYSLVMEYPIKEIIGHRDASPDLNGDGKITSNEWIKMCPCFDVRAEYPIATIIAEKK
jgi:N-acetyl-anhydromuramyl-L-alanine amidase AmpD